MSPGYPQPLKCTLKIISNSISFVKIGGKMTKNTKDDLVVRVVSTVSGFSYTLSNACSLINDTLIYFHQEC